MTFKFYNAKVIVLFKLYLEKFCLFLGLPKLRDVQIKFMGQLITNAKIKTKALRVHFILLDMTLPISLLM